EWRCGGVADRGMGRRIEGEALADRALRVRVTRAFGTTRGSLGVTVFVVFSVLPLIATGQTKNATSQGPLGSNGKIAFGRFRPGRSLTRERGLSAYFAKRSYAQGATAQLVVR